MRPTPVEELLGAKRVLELSVVPLVQDAFAAGQLKQVVDALARLAREWDEALPALTAEVEELEEMLGDPEQPGAVDASLGAMLVSHGELREALAEAAGAAADGDADAQARMLAYLRTAAERWAPR